MTRRMKKEEGRRSMERSGEEMGEKKKKKEKIECFRV
jgi:hypothetical protein